ncbi:MAG TPA: MFS transporter, partial [Pseudoclavibacter sp.]|nr:MFS transporter [Pseudoclavibacter sp.]
MNNRLRAVTGGLIGALAFVEITSGILQGYYVPLTSDIVRYLGLSSDADFNTFEGTQLLLSSLVVPVLAKLGDMKGHKKVLLISTAVTAAMSWLLVIAQGPVFFGIAWTLQGFYTVWLPLEIALIFDRGRKEGTAASTTRGAAAFLVVALESGAIVGAVASGRVFALFGGEEAL